MTKYINLTCQTNHTILIFRYLQAVTCLQDAIPKDEEQEGKKVELFHVLYNYVAICGIATSQMDVVTEFSQKSISLPIPEEQKAFDYFRCGKALYCQQKWRQAKPYADKALELFNGKDAYEDVLKLCNHVSPKVTILIACVMSNLSFYWMLTFSPIHFN